MVGLSALWRNTEQRVIDGPTVHGAPQRGLVLPGWVAGNDVITQILVILTARAICAADALAVGVVTVAAQQRAGGAVQIDLGQLLLAVVLEGVFDIADRFQGQVAIRVVLIAGQQLAAGGSYPPKSTTLTPTILYCYQISLKYLH
ncbi:hypothetical protein [Chitinivorax sp. B]|uniref:hypothetical protein n=1 Tax=Chitinivorax sp. B TaxID=2502235 RepID=UPI0010F92BCB|nr:hypothetical protein [Chitinivorax sp. B]